MASDSQFNAMSVDDLDAAESFNFVGANINRSQEFNKPLHRKYTAASQLTGPSVDTYHTGVD